MKYRSIVPAVFISRLNRFIAVVSLSDGKEETVHVKNTGRCKELLVPGAAVWLEKSDNPNRKTRYSLVAVQKGERLINMDALAPNAIVFEALESGKLVLPGLETPDTVLREKTYLHSRFDLYVKQGKREAFVEVKGVTLEENGDCFFPDAPTKRGAKHLLELGKAKREGYLAFVIFLIQMQHAKTFSPNWITDEAFGKVLLQAKEEGVCVLAYDCCVRPDEVVLDNSVPVFFGKDIILNSRITSEKENAPLKKTNRK